MEFFPIVLCEELSSFQYQLNIPDAYLFVWKFPETAAFNSLTWVVCVRIFHCVVFSAFSLLCCGKFFTNAQEPWSASHFSLSAALRPGEDNALLWAPALDVRL